MPSESLKPPSDLVARGRGRRFWRAVVAEHELRVDEHELLAETCRLLDLVDRLRGAAAEDPVVVDGRTHPALIELRQTRQQLRLHLAQLAIPDPAADAGELPAEVANLRTIKARRAARARWDNHGA